MRKIKNLLAPFSKPALSGVAGLLLAAGVVAAPSAAQADSILYLSTTETNSAYLAIVTNSYGAFQGEAAERGLTLIDQRGALSNTTASPLLPTLITPDTKLIVVATGGVTINATRMNELANIIQNNPNVVVIAFIDDILANVQAVTTAINAVRPNNWTTSLGVGSTLTGGLFTAPLNTASLYHAAFADVGLNSIIVDSYAPITGVPLDYALYTQTALSNPPPATVNNVVGFFIPQAAVNNGKGACVFMESDGAQFSNNAGIPASQFPVIAKGFTDAALDPNGACKQPAANAPDLSSSLSIPDGIVVGTPASMTLTVTNSGAPGVVASTDGGQAVVTLPQGLALVDGSLPIGCTAPGPDGASFTCALSALQPGASAPFNFQVIAAAPLSGVSAGAAVSGVPNEVNTADNSFTLDGISTSNGNPDLSVSLSGTSDLSVRSPSKVTLTVSNSNLTGVTASLSGAQVNVTLPDGLQLVNDATHPLPSGCTATATGLTCTAPALNPGSSQPFDFYVLANEPILTTDTSISATVSGGGNDTDSANNTGALSNIVATGSPDLSVALSGASGGLQVNVPKDMTLTVNNSDAPGVSTATNGSVAITLPDGLTVVPDSLPNNCTATDTGFTCDVSGLTPGGSSNFNFQVVANGPVNGSITAEATWDVQGQNGTSTTASVGMTPLDVATTSAMKPIPTLGEWAMALMALLLGAGAAVGLRRGGGTKT